MMPHPATLELIRLAEVNGSPYAAQALAEISIMSGVHYEFERHIRFDKPEVRIVVRDYPEKVWPEWFVSRPVDLKWDARIPRIVENSGKVDRENKTVSFKMEYIK